MCYLITRGFNFVKWMYETVLEFFFSLFWDRKKEPIPKLDEKHSFLAESAVCLAEKIKKRELKSEELVQAVIQRIKKINPIVNAVVDQRYEKALEEAREVDNQIARGYPMDISDKPFLGVPFTTKECQCVEGLSATLGLWSNRNERASADCDAVKRLRSAGAIPIAVTNLPELLIWSETRNPVYGVTKNPHHTGRTPGGSSGAEAALMASYATCISLSSDVAGSTRIPAFYCGQFGYHPTTNITSTKDLFDRKHDVEDSMFCLGFISKHVEDQAPLMKVLAGEKSGRLKLDREVDLKDIKFYYTESIGDKWISPMRGYLNDAMQKVLKKLEEDMPNKNKPQQFYHKGFDHICTIWKYWMGKEPEDYFKMAKIGNSRISLLWEFFKMCFQCIGEPKHSLFLLSRLAGIKFLPDVNAEWAEQLTRDMKNHFESVLGDNGVLLLPSAPTHAPYHYYTYVAPYNYGYFAIANVLRCPAVQVPLGLNSKGLPMGIQVLAGANNDALCLAVAKYLEKEFGGAIMACENNFKSSATVSSAYLRR